MKKTLWIDDDKIAKALEAYREYKKYLRETDWETRDAQKQSDMFDAFYLALNSCIPERRLLSLASICLDAEPEDLSVEGIHNVIEILGLNIVEDYDDGST